MQRTKVYITLAQLKKHGACPKARAKFKATFGVRLRVDTLTPKDVRTYYSMFDTSWAAGALLNSKYHDQYSKAVNKAYEAFWVGADQLHSAQNKADNRAHRALKRYPLGRNKQERATRDRALQRYHAATDRNMAAKDAAVETQYKLRDIKAAQAFVRLYVRQGRAG